MVAPLLAALAPLLTNLAANGLNMIGGAVMAAGKAKVEETLGVNLDDAMATPEGRENLLRLQMDKEAELHQFILAQRQQEIEEERMRLGDVADARKRETDLNASQYADWLPKNVAAIIAIVVVVGGGAILASTNEPDVRTAVVGLITLVLGYYFGSSKGSHAKDAVISKLAGDG